ncbi:MAG: PKD domain-containing protein [Solirubrobacterales bacterium]
MKYFAVALITALMLALSAAAASANGLCVGASAYCASGAEYPRTADGLASAVAAANSPTYPGQDFIYVAPGTIDLDSTISVSPSTNEDVTIIGSGIDKTIFHSSRASGAMLTLFGANALASLTDATFKLDGDPTASRQALSGNAAQISRVKFELSSVGGFSTEGFQGGGVCHNCEFILGGDGAEAGYGSGNLTFYDTSVSTVGDPTGTSGFRMGGGANLSVFSSTVSDVATGLSTDNGTLIFTDSVLDMGDVTYARGINADNPNNPSNNAVGAYVYSSTIVGTGEGQIAVRGDARSTAAPGETLNLYVRDSILLTKGSDSKDIQCNEGINGSSNMTTINDLYGVARFQADAGCSYSSTNPNPGDSYTYDDIFVNAAAGDFRLKKPVSPATNPAIDTGNTSTICDQSFDLLGNTRCVNSVTLLPQDGKIDIGAVEYQNYRPDTPVITAPSSGVAGQPLSFSAIAFDANGDPLEYAWNFGDDTGEIIGDAPSHTYVTPGSYTVRVHSQELNGGHDSVKAATATVTITAPPVVTNPIIPGITLTLKKPAKSIKFKKGAKLKNGFKASAKKPKTPFFLATASAKVTGTIKLYDKKGKAMKGSQKLTLAAGKSYLTFGGKWNNRKVPKGRYTIKFVWDSTLPDSPKSVMNIVR